MQISMAKNRNRSNYTFANINLLDKCNVDCYFCLGKDIESYLLDKKCLTTHFLDWPNINVFLQTCKDYRIKNIYLTGQNTDPLLYKYLSGIIDYLQVSNFNVGIRTNGYIAKQKIKTINMCKGGVGYSIHTLYKHVAYKILKRKTIPDWDTIIPNTLAPVRVSIVVCRYNYNEIESIIKYLSRFDNVMYIQLRRVSTDTRADTLIEDVEIFENLYNEYISKYDIVDSYENASIVTIYNKPVSFWRTIQTSANSINYFTDGTISDEYFIVEGYVNNCSKL